MVREKWIIKVREDNEPAIINETKRKQVQEVEEKKIQCRIQGKNSA
jgi:hypothetical protein